MLFGISDEYDFYTAAQYLSDDPERPNIFQNWFTTTVAAGTVITIPGLGRHALPFQVDSTASTEAIGYVRDDRFVGTMKLEYEFHFSKVSQQTRMLLSRQFGNIPDRANMTGAGRFEVELQSDI